MARPGVAPESLADVASGLLLPHRASDPLRVWGESQGVRGKGDEALRLASLIRWAVCRCPRMEKLSGIPSNRAPADLESISDLCL